MSGATTTLPTDQVQYVPGVSGPSPTAPISSVAVPQAAQQPPAQPQPQSQPSAPAPQTPRITWPSIDTHFKGQAAQPQARPLQNLEPVSADQIAQYFVQKGLTPQQARGMARAFMEESGGNPEAFNPAGGGIGAAGIAQWRADRQRRLVAQYGPNPTAQQQLDFAWQELNTTERPAFDAVRQASTEESAYNAFRSKFERPGPPAGEMQAGATFPYQEFVRRSNETYRQESDELKRLMDEASRAPEGSQERHQMMQEAMESSRRLSNTFERLATHPPTEKPVDMMQNFGSLATVIAIFGGLLAKRPLTAALGAAGTAMQAQNSGNHELFERSYQQWHDQTQLVSQAIGFQNQEFQQILQDAKLSEDEKNAEIEKKFRLFGMQHALDQAALGNWVDVYKMIDSMNKAKVDLDVKLAQGAYYKARATQLGGGAGATQLGGGAGGLNQYGDPPEDAGPSKDPNSPTPGSNIPKAIWDGATQYVLTNKMPTLGNSAAGRSAILAAVPWVLSARGMTAADQAQQGIAYTGALAGERTLATRLANLNVGLSEVPHLGEVLVKVSNETPRTDYMNVNQLIQAAELRTGDPQIVRLGAALNSYLQAYARAINPTGVITDDIRAHADHVLNQAMAKGQISAGVDQLAQELRGMQLGLQDAARMGKTMFPLPGEPQPTDPRAAPDPGSVPIPQAKYRARDKQTGAIWYSDDGHAWYDQNGIPRGQ